MAYSSFNTQFNRIGPVNDLSPTVWTYVTTDSLSTVCTSGYFNAVAGKLKAGDLVYITSASSPWTGGLAIVKSNTRNLTATPPVSGVVDLFNATLVNTSINSA
jgi:hypothetical protein